MTVPLPADGDTNWGRDWGGYVQQRITTVLDSKADKDHTHSGSSGTANAAGATLLRLTAPNGNAWDLTVANDGALITTAAPSGASGAQTDLRLTSPDGSTWSYTVANDGVLTYSEVV